MPHLRPDALDAFTLGLLNPSQREQVLRHLGACPACTATYARLESEREALEVAFQTAPVTVPAMRRSARDLVAKFAPNAQAESKPTLTPVTGAPKFSEASAPLRAFPWSRLRKQLPWAFVGAAALLCILVGLHLATRLENQQNQTQAAIDDLKQELRTQAEHADTLQREHDDAQAVAAKLMREELNLRIQDESTQQAKDREGERAWLDTRMTELQAKLDEANAKHETAREDAAQVQAQLDAEHKRLEEKLRMQAQHSDALVGEVNALNQKLEQAKNAKPVEDKANILALNVGAKMTTKVNKEDLGHFQLLNGGEVKGWVRFLGTVDPNAGMGALGIGNTAHEVFQHRGPAYAGPLVANGRIFAGDGFSGRHLVAYDSANGKRLWAFNTNDNGVGPPSITDDGSTVFFTTESCTLYGVDAKTGVRRWSRWVGDPAMTQPALSKNVVFVVHADSGARGIGTGKAPFALSCLDAHNGAPIWVAPLNADCISSPVVEGDVVYVATIDGKLSAFDAKKGKELWNRDSKATSAPVISNATAYFTTWNVNRDTGFEESLVGFDTEKPKAAQRFAGPFPSPYLLNVPLTGGNAKPSESSFEEPGAKDASTDDPRPTVPPENEKQPVLNAVWSHLGPRPTIVGQDAYLALGDRLISQDIQASRLNWELKLKMPKGATRFTNTGEPALTPPAVVNRKVFTGSAWGDLICLDSGTGRVVWRFHLPDESPIVSQIVMEKGRVYAVTASGYLVCIETGDEDATGWGMWGGSSSHNSAR